MESLETLVESYLKSAGFNIIDSREGFIVADRLVLGGDRDTRLFWTPPPSIDIDGFEVLEHRLLEEFKAIMPQYPDAKYSIVAHTLEGFSREFRSEVIGLRIRMLVPIQFFDAPFRIEENPKAASAISILRDTELARKRVPQPYCILVNDEPQSYGDDLLTVLLNGLYQPTSPSLRFIVGAAGAGKTILFGTLFSRLYQHFLDKKRRLEIFPRPTPFIPEHLRQASTLRVQELFDNFLRADVAASLPFDTFEWMLLNGYSMWLFDGLDELYTGDPDFFDYLLDLITRPDSKAQVLICVRDSLLRTSVTFARFLNEFGIEEPVYVYKLEDWDHASKRTFAWISLEERSPKKEESDTAQVAQFLDSITKSPSLKSLSGLPYYCDLLIDEFKQGKLKEFSNDFDLIDYSVSGIIKREIDKKLLSLEQLETNGLDEWLETVALELYKEDFKGVFKNAAEYYAKLVLRPELSTEEYDNAITTLIQFPLFAPGAEPGVITFKHELIAEYLAARYLLKRLPKDPTWVAQRLKRQTDFADTLLARYMANQLNRDQAIIKNLISTLRSGALHGRAFANLLQLILLSSPNRDVIKANNINLEGMDLSHVQFMYKDLKGTSLRNCDLSNTIFKACDLRDCLFEGAQLLGTRFEQISEKELIGARFGDLKQFEFIFWNKASIDDFKSMIDWITKRTGRPKSIAEPCPTALQLRALFLKFVYPDGSGHRDEIAQISLIKGKRFPKGPAPETCVKACISFGYLQEPNYRKRISRTPGDKFSDMVCFVRDWKLSTEMRQLLNSLCSIKACRHIPERHGQ